MAGDHRRRSFVGLTIGNLGQQPWAQVVGPYLTLLVASRTTSATGVAFALSAHRFLGALILPVVGRLSDRASTRAGRRVPLIVGGTIVSALLVMVMTQTRGYWQLVGAVVVARVAMQIATVGRVGVTPDVFGRSRWARALGSIAALGFLPGLFTIALIRQTWDQDDPSTWTITFVVAGVSLLIGAIAVGALVREAPATDDVARIAAKGHWRDEIARIREVPDGVHLLGAVTLLAVAFAGVNRLLPVWARDELGVGGAEFAELSVITGVITVVLVPPGLVLASRVNPRLLAVSAAVVGAVVAAACVVIQTTTMFVIATSASVPLTVAAFVALGPRLLPMFPKGDRVGQAWGMLVGPFGLMTSLAGLATATIVDAAGTTDAMWVVCGALLVVLAAMLTTLRAAPGERTDVRGLFERARTAGLGPGLFDGSVDLEDVLGVGALNDAGSEALGNVRRHG